jgi:hypothetical protein
MIESHTKPAQYGGKTICAGFFRAMKRVAQVYLGGPFDNVQIVSSSHIKLHFALDYVACKLRSNTMVQT